VSRQVMLKDALYDKLKEMKGDDLSFSEVIEVLLELWEDYRIEGLYIMRGG